MMSLLLEESPGMLEKDRFVSHKRQCSRCFCGAIVRGCVNVPLNFFVPHENYIRPMKRLKTDKGRRD